MPSLPNVGRGAPAFLHEYDCAKEDWVPKESGALALKDDQGANFSNANPMPVKSKSMENKLDLILEQLIMTNEHLEKITD